MPAVVPTRLLILAALGSFCAPGGPALAADAPAAPVAADAVAPADFPANIVCRVKAAYLRLPDGKPGREVTVDFQGAKVTGDLEAQVEVAGGAVETRVLTGLREAGQATLALPAGVGVEQAAKATITLRRKDRSVAQTFEVPKGRLWTVYLYPHSHVDIGYTNTQKNVEILHKNNILEGIKLGAETRDFPAGSRSVWNPEVTWPLERLWSGADAAKRAEITAAIKGGTLCVDASYLNEDTSAACDEEFFHFFSFSRKMQKETGVPMDVFQQMDVPGFSWGVVPVMAQQGVKYIMAWPNNDRAEQAHKEMDGRPFWWVGPDGRSKVLFFQPGCYANSGSMKKGEQVKRPWFGHRDPSKVPLRIEIGEANVDFSEQCAKMEAPDFPYDFLVLSWSLWDNNPIDADVPAAVKKWNETHVSPRIEISGGHAIMEMIEKKYGATLPMVSGDYTEYWTDGLGTAAGLTAKNRATKERLAQIETLRAMMAPGKPAPRAELDEAWRYAMLGSEHTWCAENPDGPFFQDRIFEGKTRYFREADERSRDLLDAVLAPATDKSNGWFDRELPIPGGPSQGGVAVFNTLSFARGGVLTLPRIESQPGDRVVDAAGREVPSQRLSTGELLFVADPVAAMASAHYTVTKGACGLADGCKIEGTTVLDNGLLRIELDPKTGNIIHLVDKAGGREFVDAKVDGGLNAFRWLPGYDPKDAKADVGAAIEVVENGPVVVELRVTSKAPGCRSLVRAVRLVRGQPFVECRDTVDKLPMPAKDGVHFGFAFDLPGSKTHVDLPWAVMEVEKDQWKQANRNWLVVQRWLDLSNEQAGVTWCSLDAPLFECGSLTAYLAGITFGSHHGLFAEKIPPHANIYSWAMNNHWHTNFPLTQDGPTTFRYRLAPHQGGFDAAAANRFGLAQAQPLIPLLAKENPVPASAVVLDNPRVVATVLRAEEDGSQTLRLRSLSDQEETVNLTFPGGAPKSIRDGAEAADGVAGQEVGARVVLPPKGIRSLRIVR